MIDIQIKLYGILDLAVRLLIGGRAWGTYKRAFFHGVWSTLLLMLRLPVHFQICAYKVHVDI